LQRRNGEIHRIQPVRRPVPGVHPRSAAARPTHCLTQQAHREQRYRIFGYDQCLNILAEGTGRVVESLEAALWAFASNDDYRSSVLAAVNLGDDADTTGAIVGQLAGAYYGEGGIPAAWCEKLSMRDRIEEMAEGLLGLAREPV